MLDSRIKLEHGDITQLKVDAVVNAANKSLLGGGGVDGAIHQAAGAGLLEFNKTLGGCETGEATISPGFNLPARHIISTVGPVWKGGGYDEEELLESCYTSSLKLAVENNVRSIAFPSISTGVYGFPFNKACKIALSAIDTFLQQETTLEQVILVSFSERDYKAYQEIFKEINERPLI